MKLKNIYAIIGLFLLMVGCSNDLDTIKPENNTDGNGYYLTVKLGQTISGRGTDSETDQDIKTLCVVLLDNNNVIKGCRYFAEGTFSIADGIITCNGSALTFVTKEKVAELAVVVIANSKNHFIGAQSLAGLTFDSDDCKNALKMGKATFSLSENAASKENPYEVAVALKQMTARVELGKLTPKFDSGDIPVPVTLKRFAVKNIYEIATLSADGTLTPVSSLSSGFVDFGEGIIAYDWSTEQSPDLNGDAFIHSFATGKSPQVEVTYSCIGNENVTGSFDGNDGLIAENIYRMDYNPSINTPEYITGSVRIKGYDGKEYLLQTGHQVNCFKGANLNERYDGLIDEVDKNSDYATPWTKQGNKEGASVILAPSGKPIAADTKFKFLNESSSRDASDLGFAFTCETTVGEWLNNPDLVLSNENLGIIPVILYNNGELISRETNKNDDHIYTVQWKNIHAEKGLVTGVRVCMINEHNIGAPNAVIIYRLDYKEEEFNLYLRRDGHSNRTMDNSSSAQKLLKIFNEGTVPVLHVSKFAAAGTLWD